MCVGLYNYIPVWCNYVHAFRPVLIYYSVAGLLCMCVITVVGISVTCWVWDVIEEVSGERH